MKDSKRILYCMHETLSKIIFSVHFKADHVEPNCKSFKNLRTSNIIKGMIEVTINEVI